MKNRGTVKTIQGRMGCPIGEVRSMVDGKCYKNLKTKPQSNVFNVRHKTTGKILSSSATGGKNTFSAILRYARDQAERKPVIVTSEKIIYDSTRDKKLNGAYLYRDMDVLKTAYVP